MKIEYKKSPVTFGVIAICALMYLYTTYRFSGYMTAFEALQVGALHPLWVIEGNQYYRLLTANILHYGFMHMFLNCYSLYTIGTMMGLEQTLKTKRYLFVIVISMLFTTGVPCLLYRMFAIGGTSVMAGLSGVVFGLIGAMSALALYYKGQFLQVFKQIYQSVIAMLIISVIVPSISLVGHVAGMLGGFIAVLIIIKWNKIIRRKTKEPKEETLIH